MAAKTFLDTNVLIYAVDRAFPEKQIVALEIISRHARNRTGVISTQVLQEFYSAATRKLAIDPLKAKQHVRDFQIFDVIQITPAMIESGIDCSILNQLSFWDGLIVEAASAAGCELISSEDLTAGQVIRGVKIFNPFIS